MIPFNQILKSLSYVRLTWNLNLSIPLTKMKIFVYSSVNLKSQYDNSLLLAATISYTIKGKVLWPKNDSDINATSP